MSAATVFRLRLVAASLLAGVAAILAVCLAVPLSLPLSSWDPPAPLVAVSEARAVAAAGSDPADLETAEHWTRQTLQARPGEATAWARMAWIAAERNDVPGLRDALERSYTVAPYGPDVTAWRLRFAYGNWGRLTPELQALADQELAVMTRYRPAVVNAARADLADPLGRLAFDLAVLRVRAEPRQDLG
jgi:cytochrome c-type biogenesis protein CcmH/NrfG